LTQRLDRPFPGITAEAMELLVRYDWPGNVRELRNLVESMVVLMPERPIDREDIPLEIRSPTLGRRLLPVPAGSMDWSGQPDQAQGDGALRVRPELEFIFRTLVELRVDMDQVRREFELYRDEIDDRLGGPAAGPLAIPSFKEGKVEVGVRGPGHEEFPVSELLAPISGTRDPSLAVPEERTMVFRPGMTIEELEKQAIVVVLQEVHGNRRKAAESLGIGERTLYRKIQKYGVED